MTIEGWKCPHCGKAHAPHVFTCPDPAQASPVYVPSPFYMPAPYPGPPYYAPWIVTCQTLGDTSGIVPTVFN